MALETLKGVEELGGFKVLQERPLGPDGKVDWDKFDELRNDQPIFIHDDINTISFKIQDGPVKENGVNGCQVDTLLHAAHAILHGLNEKYPCGHNEQALEDLGKAIAALEARTADREARGVEGESKA